MRLPAAYRGLTRPSSAPEPSHPPNSVADRLPIDIADVQVAYDGNHGFEGDSILLPSIPFPKKSLLSLGAPISPPTKQGCCGDVANDALPL